MGYGWLAGLFAAVIVLTGADAYYAHAQYADLNAKIADLDGKIVSLETATAIQSQTEKAALDKVGKDVADAKASADAAAQASADAAHKAADAAKDAETASDHSSAVRSHSIASSMRNK
jgi:TolA-binding protein